MEKSEDIVIVGGGIAGLATALALKRVGIKALVLERSPELRTTGAALTLFPNAWLALEALGVAHKLTSIYSPLRKGFVTNVANGAIQQVTYTGISEKFSGPIPVHRRSLLETLAGELPSGTIRFSSKLTSIRTAAIDDEASSGAIVSLDDGTVIKAKVLIGCDGLHSVVARWLGLKEPVKANRSAIRGLAVFPEGHGHKEEEVYQFIDQGKRAAFVPLNDKELYWFLTYSSTIKGEETATDPKSLQKDVIENLAKDFPPSYLEVAQHADLATVSWAPLMFRYPWNLLFGQVCKGSITVAGDAMHPMTPDLGQGGCSALEDAVVLGRHLGNSFLLNGRRIVAVEAAKAIEGYVKERRWRAATLITGSYISGWVQQGGSSSIMKFFRDTIFYKFLYRILFDSVGYDCGKLPSVSSSSELDGDQTKID
ncbi:monooxygenase 2-like [Macadamia integrifolia]|uniref:monooxygenase 2-like n=1 Tax=Macadamia integrifolia TaxID=60698 RepID=UPI001C52D13F|nr:monooxygenase 2-like [Macadamia integrifolia]